MFDLLFVYGTLRRGHENPMAEFLANNAKVVGDGRFQGRMYQISYYPGVVASDDPNDHVYGEVYRLYDPKGCLQCLMITKNVVHSMFNPPNMNVSQHGFMSWMNMHLNRPGFICINGQWMRNLE